MLLWTHYNRGTMITNSSLMTGLVEGKRSRRRSRISWIDNIWCGLGYRRELT